MVLYKKNNVRSYAYQCRESLDHKLIHFTSSSWSLVERAGFVGMQCDDEVETEKRISASGPEGLLLRSSKNVRGNSPRNKLAE